MTRSIKTCRYALIAFAAAVLAGPSVSWADQSSPLRVCTDPDNMPFSNNAGEGFENKLAGLVAGELGRPLTYTWTPSPREALAEHRCDVVVGVPNQMTGVTTTLPYYWSSYVLISRADRGLDVSSLKDHRLRKLKIGVAAIGDNLSYSPPAEVLVEAKLGHNLVGYRIDVPGQRPGAAAAVDAVAHGDIDFAALWGPLAGYFVQRSPVKLTMTVIGDTDEFSSRKTHLKLLGLQYEIAMAVRPDDSDLQQALDKVIARKQSAIDTLLESFGVPLLKPEQLSALAHLSDDGD